MAVHDVQRVLDRLLGLQRDRVDDQPGFGALDLGHLVGLRLDGEVLVDEAEAALLRHADRGAMLGDRVHRRGDQRQGQADARRDARGQVDVVGVDRRGTGRKENVVEGQAFFERGLLQRRPPVWKWRRKVVGTVDEVKKGELLEARRSASTTRT